MKELIIKKFAQKETDKWSNVQNTIDGMLPDVVARELQERAIKFFTKGYKLLSMPDEGFMDLVLVYLTTFSTKKIDNKLQSIKKLMLDEKYIRTQTNEFEKEDALKLMSIFKFLDSTKLLQLNGANLIVVELSELLKSYE